QPERRAAAMGFYQSAYGVGMTVGPAAMGLFISLFGLRPAFLTASALSVLTGLLSMALLRETNVLSRTIQ
ncbi:MAG TPA: MFS transporter, partial [Candidatus Limnocylindria bacterium]|nr:MFS transporter [Candidatus Limnocylindria bacterium]